MLKNEHFKTGLNMIQSSKTSGLPIKNLQSLKQPISSMKLLFIVFCPFIHLDLFMCYWVFIAGEFPKIPEVYFGIAFASALIMVFVLFCVIEPQRKKTEKAFEGQLPNLDLNTLNILSTSPELTSEEKSLITNYLNANHKGWSLNQSGKI